MQMSTGIAAYNLVVGLVLTVLKITNKINEWKWRANQVHSDQLCSVTRMFLVGLTGGIASGKSTVSSILRELGCPIIDADVVARKGGPPGPGFDLGRSTMVCSIDHYLSPLISFSLTAYWWYILSTWGVFYLFSVLLFVLSLWFGPTPKDNPWYATDRTLLPH